MKKSRAIRVWLVVLSVVAVTIIAGCGGAAAAIRSIGRVAPRAAPVVKPVVQTPPRLPPVTGAPLRVGTKVDHAAGAGRDGVTIHTHVPSNGFPTSSDRDDRRKK